MNEHEVDVLVGVTLGDFLQFVDEEGVAGDVDSMSLQGKR